MKKIYDTPSVEKINFQYRDQVVVASGAVESNIPVIGGWTNDQGSTGCKWYVVEAWGLRICNIL